MTDPELARIHLMMSRRRYAEAEVRVRRVLSQRPEDEWALRILAGCLTRQDRNVEALDAAQQACRAKPEEPLCWVQLANVRIALRQAPAAVAAAERAVSMSPHHAVTHSALARAFLTESQAYRPRTAHDPQRALAAADDAVRLAPDDPDYRCTRAWALVLLERSKEATREYHRVLESSPNNTTAVNGLGWVNRRHHPIRAAGYYARSLGLTPQSEVVKINLKGALLMWIFRMIWIWVWGGLGLGVLRWLVPRQVCFIGLVGLSATCLIGTVMLRHKIPRGALRMVLALRHNPFLLLLGRLAGSIVAAILAALAPPTVAIVAIMLLMAFLLIEWKIDFTDMDRRFTAWVTRS